jgi:ABC-type Mn2+/Zn2+ transport system permease subunit
MSGFLEPFSEPFMQRALVAGALIGLTNGFLGCFIILRRMSLMADALSHSMLPGLAVGIMLFGLSPLSLFCGGLVAALFVAAGAQFMARNTRIKEETALAVLYTIAFSLGMILMRVANSRVSLLHYLFGDVLVLASADVWLSYAVALVVIPLFVALERPLLLTLFDPVGARSQGVPVQRMQMLIVVASVLTMIASVQAVGVVLMLGLLVAPAATLYLFTDSYPRMLWGSALIGALGSVAGLLISYQLDQVSGGACVVLLLGAVFCVALIISPKYGVIRRWRTRTRSRAAFPTKQQ